MSTPTTAETPQQARAQLADTIEDIGQAIGLLRECQQSLQSGNTPGAKMCASDALAILDIHASKCSTIAQSLWDWVQEAE